MSDDLRPMRRDDLPRVRSAARAEVLAALGGVGVDETLLDAELLSLYCDEALDDGAGWVTEGRAHFDWLFLRAVESPIDGASEGRIDGFSPRDAETGRRLLGAAIECVKRRGYRSLRALLSEPAPFSEALFCAEEGWELAAYGVRKTLVSASLSALPGVVLRGGQPADAPFVVDCLTEALRKGLGADERARWDEATLRAAADRALASVVGPDMGILIAEALGERVGHATGKLCGPVPGTGQRDAILLDAFVVASHGGRGIATALTELFEQVALRRGAARVYGTVIGESPEHARRILANVRQRGYEAAYRLVRRTL